MSSFLSKALNIIRLNNTIMNEEIQTDKTIQNTVGISLTIFSFLFITIILIFALFFNPSPNIAPRPPSVSFKIDFTDNETITINLSRITYYQSNLENKRIDMFTLYLFDSNESEVLNVNLSYIDISWENNISEKIHCPANPGLETYLVNQDRISAVKNGTETNLGQYIYILFFDNDKDCTFSKEDLIIIQIPDGQEIQLKSYMLSIRWLPSDEYIQIRKNDIIIEQIPFSYYFE